MYSLKDLYQEVIIEHSKNPRHLGSMQDPTHQQEGFNPLCGDKIKVYLQICNNKITAVNYESCGCAISTASASLMAEAMTGKTIEQAEAMFKAFHLMVTTDTVGDEKVLGKLLVLGGVAAYPSRVKCASLAWHTLQAAYLSKNDRITTE